MSDNLFEPQEGATQENLAAAPTPETATPQGQETNTAQTVDTSTLFADQLAGIKTPDGRQKYADVNTALASIPHAQTHINSLEKQVGELQEELNKRQGMEQVLERIQASQTTNAESPSVNSLDEASIAQLVESVITQKETTKIAQTNEIAFSNELRTKFGDKAMDVLQSTSQELGISMEFMQSLAQKSPKAALKYFEDKQPTATAQPSTPGMNTAAMPTGSKPDAKKMAMSKLVGESDPLISKWREAAPQN